MCQCRSISCNKCATLVGMLTVKKTMYKLGGWGTWEISCVFCSVLLWTYLKLLFEKIYLKINTRHKNIFTLDILKIVKEIWPFIYPTVIEQIFLSYVQERNRLLNKRDILSPLLEIIVQWEWNKEFQPHNHSR